MVLGNPESAPPEAKVGMRISYYHGTALIAGKGYNWTSDDQGNWVDPDTGQHYSRIDKAGTAGAGIDEYNIVFIDDKRAIVGHSTLSLLQGAFYFVTEMGTEGPASTAGTIFMNPAALQALPSNSDPDHAVIHGYWPVGGKNVDAVITKGKTPNGHVDFAYAAHSGLMVHFGSMAVGGASPVTQGETNTPSTSMTEIDLLGARTLSVPWANDPDPPCAADFHSMDFRGRLQLNGCTQTYEIKYTMKDKGSGWVLCDVVSTTGSLVPNGNSTDLNSSIATGSTQLDPLWINPSTLAKLQPGQELDTDPYSKIVTKVGDRQDGPKGPMIVIQHTTPIQVLTYGYDLQTGMLVFIHNSDGAFGRDTQVALASND